MVDVGKVGDRFDLKVFEFVECRFGANRPSGYGLEESLESVGVGHGAKSDRRINS
jgi:hypothetical protein